jgi:hypothetical protein
VALVAAAAVVLALIWRRVRGPQRKRYAIGLLVLLLAVGLARLAYRGQIGRLSPDEIGATKRLFRPAQRARMFHEIVDRNIPLLFEGEASVAMFGNELGPGLNSLACALLIVLGVGLARRQPLWGILCFLLLVQWTLFLPVARYFIVVLPLLAYAWWRWSAWLARRLPGKAGETALLLSMLLWTVPNLAKTAGIIIEQRRRPFLEHYRDGRYAGCYAMAECIRARLPADAVVLTGVKMGPALEYLTGRQVLNSTDLKNVDYDTIENHRDNAVYAILAGGDTPLTETILAQRHFVLQPAILEVSRAPGRAPLSLHPAFSHRRLRREQAARPQPPAPP